MPINSGRLVNYALGAVRPRITRMEQRIADRVTAQLATETAPRVAEVVSEQIRGELSRLLTTTVLEGRIEPRLAQIEAELVRNLHAEMVEVARMLRIQGDADDELASTLGRTLLRLSAEVEELAAAVGRLRAQRGGGRGSPGSGKPPSPSGARPATDR